jgi:hypothetical protein
MFDAGFMNLTLWDIEVDAILQQQSYFENHTSVRVLQFDILAEDLSGYDDKDYDVIVDKGFLDVFLRQGK